MDGATITIYVTIMATSVGAVWAVYRLLLERKDKYRNALNTAQDKTIMEHKERLDRHSVRLSKMDEIIKLMNNDMLRNYTTHAQLASLEKTIDGKLEKMFTVIGAMSKDLNQAIGNIEATKDTEIKSLVSEIRDALKQDHE